MPYSPAWISSVSRGVKNGSKIISCGTTPIERLALRGCWSVSNPQMIAFPLLFTTRPARMLISVDLPAPLGPSSPKIWPRGTSKLTLSSASLPPAYVFDRESMRIAASSIAARVGAAQPRDKREPLGPVSCDGGAWSLIATPMASDIPPPEVIHVSKLQVACDGSGEIAPALGHPR